ncbi:MAG: crotonase/enoyl-CoA hydratase family protein [Rhodobacter sp.]|nr:crotonase/enoyl-CoA hydratase family protein [Rhodobacter sp.]MCY4167418.1 crotonase/enoyl-CoA hydratase family protein [Rhodobacter sp.]MCY4241839.1 crotonase/enoyl-CoA hydratase family protein [Rhodobacter sp.]
MFETLDVRIDPRGVAVLALDRPARHNALNAAMIRELTRAAKVLGEDEAVRAVILTGTGRSFCAGGDLGWMRQQMEGDRKSRAAQARGLAEMLLAMNTIPKPLIGRLQGSAFGGGVGMACVCDVAIGVSGSKYGLTETRLGLVPATVGPYVIARMGEAKARRVFMSGRVFGTEEAVTLGLLAKSVHADDLDLAIEAEVVPYLDAAPGAVAEAKALLGRLVPVVDGAVVEDTVATLMGRWEQEEAWEGIRAFFEKRKPAWTS